MFKSYAMTMMNKKPFQLLFSPDDPGGTPPSDPPNNPPSDPQDPPADDPVKFDDKQQAEILILILLVHWLNYILLVIEIRKD